MSPPGTDSVLCSYTASFAARSTPEPNQCIHGRGYCSLLACALQMKLHCSPLRLVSTCSMWSAEYCELQSVIVEHTCRTSRSRTRDIESAHSNHSGRSQCSPFCTHMADVSRRKPSRCFSTIRDSSARDLVGISRCGQCHHQLCHQCAL